MIFITIVGMAGIAISLLTNAAMIELPGADAVQTLELEGMNQELFQPNVKFTDVEHIGPKPETAVPQ